MSALCRFSSAARAAMLDALVDLFDAGAPPGTLEIRTGAQPAHTSDPDSGTLLVEFDLATTAFAAASGGSVSANAIADQTAVAGGTAGHWRMKNAAGTVVAQGNCGTSASCLILNSVTIVSGGLCSVISWTFTIPEDGA